MKLSVTVGEVRHEVFFDEAYGQRKVELDGTPIELTLLRLDGCRLRCTLDGRPVDALVTGQLPDLVVDAGDGPWHVSVEESRLADVRKIAQHASHVAVATQLKAPMPGLVTRVLVAQGDTVAPGTPILVMEAMKMENELRAPGAGRVKGIRVRPGEAVELGSVLVDFEPPDSAGKT